MRPKLYVPDQLHYARPFLSIYDLTDNLAIADTVMFTGGADIAPAFYGENPGKHTYTSPARDVREKKLFDLSLGKGKKFLGICRGHQLLAAMTGGKLAQHVEGHGIGFHSMHLVTTNEGEQYAVNSVHHQMVLPSDEHELLAWSEKRSPKYLNGEDQEIEGVEVEPEIVYFPLCKGLGIQCHPESGFREGNPAMTYFHRLVKERLLEA